MPPPKRVQTMVANSAGQPLFEHLHGVALVARSMASACGITDSAALDEVEAAGWTHDLGKASTGMQVPLACGDYYARTNHNLILECDMGLVDVRDKTTTTSTLTSAMRSNTESPIAAGRSKTRKI